MRKPMIAGNWKMQGTSASNNKLVNQLVSLTDQQWSEKLEMVICPPFVYLDQIQKQLSSTVIQLSAQDVSAYESGAYTGQVAASMLKEVGCQWVIIGHSERRQLCHESNELMVDKIRQALAVGLKPILCLGETQAEREHKLTQRVVAEQIEVVLNAFSANELTNWVVAYEPIWAIGTGLTATPEEAQAVHAFLRGKIANFDEGLAKTTRILYGGSVKPENAAGLFAMADIDGALVGGASLVADSFHAICAAQFDAN